MTFIDILQAVLHGPFGDFPFAIVAWQAILVGAIYMAARLLRGRIPKSAFSPLRPLGRGASVAARNLYVLVAIGLLLPLAELFTGGYLISVTYGVELYVMLAIGLNIVVGFTGLLDLGYVAFFAVGAYVYGIFASPQLAAVTHATLYFLVPAGTTPGIHISMWVLLPVAGLVAALFGALIYDPVGGMPFPGAEAFARGRLP